MVTAVLPEAAAGAEQTLELLYRDHSQDVSRYALAVLGDRSDAEDVTQTTFLNAYRALQRGERPLEPEHWLIAIAHNACRERWRRGQRRPREVLYVEDVSAAPAGDEDGPTADELRAALLQLHASQRTALVMRELEGRSYAEIAQALEISVPAVEALLFRARQALREQLDEQLPCRDAVAAIGRQADGELSRGERAGLRAHLRRCPECSQVARSRRARGPVLGGFLPIPSWLSSLVARITGSTVSASGGGVGAVGLVGKAVAVVVAGVVVGGTVSAGATQLGRPGAHTHAGGTPVAPSPAARHSSLSRAHAPVRVAGREARPTPAELPAGPPSRPESVPAPPTVPAPQDAAQAGSAASVATDVPQAQLSAGAAAADNGHAAKAAAAASAVAGANGKAASVTPGKSAEAKAAAQAKKAEQHPATSAATPASPKADPAVPAQPNAQGNGQGSGQANGQANGQATGQGNGQAAAPAAGPPAALPAQANAGANGHH